MTPDTPPFPPRLRLLLAIGLPALLGLGMSYLAVKGFSSYGWTLFLGVPIVVSFISSLIYRRLGEATRPKTYGVSLLSLLLLGGLILIFAIDGLICLLMALPLAAALALIGCSIGYALGERLSAGVAKALPLILCAAFPFLVAFENRHPTEPLLHSVTTRITVAAPIQSVWQEVIAFNRITAPPTGLFRLGIAYPIEAKIEGEGVGAIRHCIFSTGPFIEPITRWETPHTLAFDVISNPPALKELSPWKNIETPHLDGTFTSRRGEFKLYEQEGKTILEGTTWYTQTITPDWYWHHISDQIIHLVHLRVLEHIKETTERPGSPQTHRR